MTQAPDESTPILAYERVGDDKEMVWAVRFAAAWIITFSALTLIEAALRPRTLWQLIVAASATGAIAAAAALKMPLKVIATIAVTGIGMIVAKEHAMFSGVPVRYWLAGTSDWIGGLAGIAIGLAVLRQQRWGFMCAIAFVGLAPFAVLSSISAWRDAGYIVLPSLILAIADVTVLWVLMRRAERCGVLRPALSGGATGSTSGAPTTLLVQLVGGRVIATCIAVFGQLVLMIVMEPDTFRVRLLTGYTAMILTCYLMFAPIGVIMVLRRVWGLVLATGLTMVLGVAQLSSLMLTSGITPKWRYAMAPALAAAANCTLMLVLSQKVRRENSLPQAIATGE